MWAENAPSWWPAMATSALAWPPHQGGYWKQPWTLRSGCWYWRHGSVRRRRWQDEGHWSRLGLCEQSGNKTFWQLAQTHGDRRRRQHPNSPYHHQRPRPTIGRVFWWGLTSIGLWRWWRYSYDREFGPSLEHVLYVHIYVSLKKCQIYVLYNIKNNWWHYWSVLGTCIFYTTTWPVSIKSETKVTNGSKTTHY